MTAVQGVGEGDILAGKYRIEKILGRGAMGIVVAARHLELDERVAIKFLLPENLDNPAAVARFQREARAAAKIKSEHVARVGDVGTLESGAPFMVMEHLEGGDLAAWLEERGPLSIEQTIEFVLQALEAIAEAHALGIIHRDLKPANLFWIRRADGLLSIKVLDFGISKIGGAAGKGADLSMTKTADVMGSPLYMSPEQMRSARDVDATTDIWALGVILFELLTGEAPFVADNLPELVLKIASGAPLPMRCVTPALPSQLEQVILRCLEKDRMKRYRNVAELAAALVEFGPKRARASAERTARTIQTAGLSENEFASPPSSNPVPTGSSEETMARRGRTSPHRTTRQRAIFGLVSALATAIAVVAYFFSTPPVPEASLSPASPSAAALPTAGPLPVRTVEGPTLDAAKMPPTPSSVASSSPARFPVIEPVDKQLVPPAKAQTQNTAGSPTRSTKTKLPSAASSSALPRAALGPLPSVTPPRTGSAYDDRK